MTRRIIIGVSILLLCLHAALQVRLAALDSPTTDEAVHLSAGYTYLTKGDFRFNPEHPPLIKALAALPLLALHVQQPENFDDYWSRADSFFYDSWRENREYGEALFYRSGNDANTLIFWGRLPMVLITLLLGSALFAIALKHWGEWAALTAVGLFVTNPTIAGHGHLVTTDVGLALGYLLAAYAAWRFFQQPNWPKAAWLGAAIALALLIKHTAIIILPVLLLWLIIDWVKQRRSSYARRVLPKLLLSVVVSWVIIWAGFGFHDRVVPASSSITTDVATSYAAEQSDELSKAPNATVDRVYQAVRPALMLLPADYLKGVFLVLNHVNNGQDSYLLGQFSGSGWWYYFPLLLLLKTPLAALLLIGSGIYLLVRSRGRDSLAVALAAAAGLFLLFAMSSKANLGVRHIMPVLPLLFAVSAWAVASSPKLRPVAMALLVWSGLVFAFSFPTYLGYFNELSLGSNNGYKIATDSNLDWGQDLKRIRHYIDRNDIRQPYVEYGWLGRYALDYYLGAGNYRSLGDGAATVLRSGDTVIIGASAYNQPKYAFLKDCDHFTQITSGTFACSIK